MITVVGMKCSWFSDRKGRIQMYDFFQVIYLQSCIVDNYYANERQIKMKIYVQVCEPSEFTIRCEVCGSRRCYCDSSALLFMNFLKLSLLNAPECDAIWKSTKWHSVRRLEGGKLASLHDRCNNLIWCLIFSPSFHVWKSRITEGLECWKSQLQNEQYWIH